MNSGACSAQDPNKKTETKKWGNWPKPEERLSQESTKSDPLPSAKSSKLETELARQLKLAGIPFVREVMPIPGRRYRYDFALKGILCECNGMTFQFGGHSSGTGLARDYEKNILAQLEGWRVFSFDKAMIFDGRALSWIQMALHKG